METKRVNTTKRMVITILLLILVFGGIFGWWLFRKMFLAHIMATYHSPPVTISATKATTDQWHPQILAVGSLRAVNGVDVTTQVGGVVTQILFQSGQYVKAGTPLVQLDASVEKAQLESYKAQKQLAKLDFNRQAKLFKQRTTSAAAYDSAVAQLKINKAQVEQTEAAIAQKNIKAPFSGRLGIREVDLGSYVSPGTKLVTLQSLDNLYAEFSLPQQYLPRLYVGQEIKVADVANPKHIVTGKINAINSKVDVSTRNVLVQALIPNDSHQLLPGMSAEVTVIEPAKQNVVTVPVTAISYSMYGDSVFVITASKDKAGKPQKVANRVFVTVGDTRGNTVEIVKGLQAGAEIVTSGQLKLHNGSKVNVNNKVKL